MCGGSTRQYALRNELACELIWSDLGAWRYVVVVGSRNEITERSPLTLSRGELEELCDTVQPKRMAEWLNARGWVFEPARRRGGVPKVDRSYYAERMSGRAQSHPRSLPQLDFMRARH